MNIKKITPDRTLVKNQEKGSSSKKSKLIVAAILWITCIYIIVFVNPDTGFLTQIAFASLFSISFLAVLSMFIKKISIVLIVTLLLFSCLTFQILTS